jgi:uncharacterized protein (DUF58 family)
VTEPTPDPRIHATLSHLRSLRGPARGLSFLPNQKSNSALNGRHASRLRGRGLNFDEMRLYLPGDDIRSIDWKATARTGKPHVRVFTEERDRPALVAVDQRMSMFFGSRLNMKSVTAAEAAAISAFRVLDVGDRIGGIVFDEDGQDEFKPRRSQRAAYAFLEAIARKNSALNAGKVVSHQPGALNRVLESVARIAHHDHLIVVLSDFEGVDERTHRHLSGIAAHNDLILVFVHDPLGLKVESEDRTVIGDAEMQAELDLGKAAVRESLSELSRKRLDLLSRWQSEINLSLMPLSAAEETLPQVRKLLGRLAMRRRVR